MIYCASESLMQVILEEEGQFLAEASKILTLKEQQQRPVSSADISDFLTAQV